LLGCCWHAFCWEAATSYTTASHSHACSCASAIHPNPDTRLSNYTRRLHFIRDGSGRSAHTAWLHTALLWTASHLARTSYRCAASRAHCRHIPAHTYTTHHLPHCTYKPYRWPATGPAEGARTTAPLSRHHLSGGGLTCSAAPYTRTRRATLRQHSLQHSCRCHALSTRFHKTAAPATHYTLPARTSRAAAYRVRLPRTRRRAILQFYHQTLGACSSRSAYDAVGGCVGWHFPRRAAASSSGRTSHLALAAC